MGNELNRQFSKEKVQIANKYMKKCSAFLAIMETQIKTTLRFLLSSVRMAITNNANNNKSWRACGEKEHFYTVAGNIN
jgi:hypothetical protein